MPKLICPNCGTEVTHANQHDGRMVPWRVRVRLFGPNNMDELAADTDPDTEPNKPGETIVRGLPGVADHLLQLASSYHQRPCAGLDTATLQHRLKGLRPTLSRRKGNAVWRVPYTTPEGDWVARVDLERITDTGDDHASSISLEQGGAGAVA